MNVVAWFVCVLGFLGIVYGIDEVDPRNIILGCLVVFCGILAVFVDEVTKGDE